MITILDSKEIDCPCGCGAKVLSTYGTVENGSTPMFRAMLMTGSSTPNLWVMLITGPWEGKSKDCAVVLHSVREPGGIRSYVAELQSSPWAKENLQELQALTRDEVLSNPATKEWVFDTWSLVVHEEPLASFLVNNA